MDVCAIGDEEDAIFEAILDYAPSIIETDSFRLPLFLKSACLNELPFPARHLVDVDN